jgi:hypothetical protein
LEFWRRASSYRGERIMMKLTIGQMERAAGFAHDDSPKTKLDKFDALLA